jgi:preprotein translocase subunit YajC
MISLLQLLGIETALADHHATASHQPGLTSMLPSLAAFALIVYFMLIKPQQKKDQEKKSMIDSLQPGDEIIFSGILGKIEHMEDNYALVAPFDGPCCKIQKHAITAILPKGTIGKVANKKTAISGKTTKKKTKSSKTS